ncbi:MAG: glycosyltransferase [Candidatus Pacebacteria bacterium]|nr:glycosyltransferase [Candidatus Paceibacterota bacterium]
MISVVLATYNEEKNIERCLDAVKDWVDEMIVVDGTSADSTRELAAELGAKVIKTTNKPNFHINKQMAIDKARGELILQLDADEVVDQELKDFINQVHQKLMANPSLVKESAWYVKRKNLFMGQWLRKGGQYPDPVIRLFVKGKAYLPQKDVHEQMKVEGLVGTAEGHLLHYANPRFKDYLRKFNTYTSFKATQLEEQGLELDLFNSLNYLLIKPIFTFFNLYLRHKGFVDGLPGLIFAAMSGYHHHVAYLKLGESYRLKKLAENQSQAKIEIKADKIGIKVENQDN